MPDEPVNYDLKRRELLKLGAVSVVAATVGRAQTPHRFFTPEEWAITDEFAEILIPVDSVSPGARAAKVTDYIDMRLADGFDDDDRKEWRAGLALVDQLSHKLNNTAFVKGTPKQREAVVLAMAENEKEPKSPEELFFRTIKGHTARAYYSSKIGIHEDMDYKGNVFQLGDYAGTLPPGPALGKMSGSE
jgi:hypothetical protein